MATTNNNSGINWKGLFNFIAFIAVAAVGVSLILTKVLKSNGDIVKALETIANVLAYIVVAFYSFIYAHRKLNRKNVWYMVIWAVAVVLIVMYYVIK